MRELDCRIQRDGCDTDGLCSNCGASEGQWCTWASTLQGTQLGGTEVPADAGDGLTIHCKLC